MSLIQFWESSFAHFIKSATAPPNQPGYSKGVSLVTVKDTMHACQFALNCLRNLKNYGLWMLLVATGPNYIGLVMLSDQKNVDVLVGPRLIIRRCKMCSVYIFYNISSSFFGLWWGGGGVGRGLITSYCCIRIDVLSYAIIAMSRWCGVGCGG